ncbi:MAG: hypothetical protein U0797_10795 [Gemmataceae bacterium]
MKKLILSLAFLSVFAFPAFGYAGYHYSYRWHTSRHWHTSHHWHYNYHWHRG